MTKNRAEQDKEARQMWENLGNRINGLVNEGLYRMALNPDEEKFARDEMRKFGDEARFFLRRLNERQCELLELSVEQILVLSHVLMEIMNGNGKYGKTLRNIVGPQKTPWIESSMEVAPFFLPSGDKVHGTISYRYGIKEDFPDGFSFISKNYGKTNETPRTEVVEFITFPEMPQNEQDVLKTLKLPKYWGHETNVSYFNPRGYNQVPTIDIRISGQAGLSRTRKYVYLGEMRFQDQYSRYVFGCNLGVQERESSRTNITPLV